MAKNYNSSENCHNEADKNTSNRNASRNTSNKTAYGKNASDRNVTDKNANNKNAYDKDAKDKAADKEQNKMKLEIISTDNDVLVISKDGEKIGFKPNDMEFSKFSSKFAKLLKVSVTTALEWIEQNGNKVSIDK